MAKGMPRHTGDPRIQTGQQSFDKYPTGNETVNDIARFISLDTSDPQNPKPIFVEQNEQLVVRFIFKKMDGTDGPPCSATAPEFWAIVRALGGEVDQEKPTTRHTSEALARGLKSVNERQIKNGIKVYVNNRWVNGDRIDLATPPEGKYTIKFLGMHRLDYAQDNLQFSEYKNERTNKMQQVLIADFEILSNGFGKPTLWDGYKLSAWMENPFTDMTVDTNGKTVNAVDKGYPLFARKPETKEIVRDAFIWENFGTYFAPSLKEYEWIIDPSKSDFHVCEVLEPQYVFNALALKDNRKVVVNYKKHPLGKKPNISQGDIPFDNELADIDVDEQQTQAETTSSSVFTLVSYLESKFSDVKIFENSNADSNEFNFTDAGKEWAIKNMGGEEGPWVRAGLSLENRKALHELTEEEATNLLNAFKATTEPTEDMQW